MDFYDITGGHLVTITINWGINLAKIANTERSGSRTYFTRGSIHKTMAVSAGCIPHLEYFVWIGI
jgi:hypothetical protein